MPDEVRTAETVVTSETLAEFQQKRLDLAAPEAKAEPAAQPVEAQAPEQPGASPAEPAAEAKPEVEKEKPPKELNKLEKRFHELTTARRDAEAREAEALRKAEAAEARAREIEQKYNPPKTPEGQKPQPSEYATLEEFTEALEKYTREQTEKELNEKNSAQRNKEESERRLLAFNEAEAKNKASIADYDEVIAASETKVSNELRDAIMDSDVGYLLRYHLAKNPTEADRLNKLTVGGMLREVGKLEVRLTQPAPKSQAAEVVEISRAPAPISPLKGANAPVDLPINAKGEWTGSLSEYKAARAAGKIK